LYGFIQFRLIFNPLGPRVILNTLFSTNLRPTTYRKLELLILFSTQTVGEVQTQDVFNTDSGRSPNTGLFKTDSGRSPNTGCFQYGQWAKSAKKMLLIEIRTHLPQHPIELYHCIACCTQPTVTSAPLFLRRPVLPLSEYSYSFYIRNIRDGNYTAQWYFILSKQQ
jgi:hypothetical protein